VLNSLSPDPDPPPLLYHYTDARGLEGILRDRRLWAHDVEFMNDTSEIRHGRALVETLAEKKLRASKNPIVKEILTDYARKVDRFGTIQVFAACFCEKGDLLSQWRSYGGGRGYALGFDSHVLNWKSRNLPHEETDEERKWVLIKVRYRLSQQRASIREVLNAECAYWETLVAQDGATAIRNRKDRLLSVLEAGMAPRILKAKNPSFREEKEWRAVLLIGQDAVKRTSIKTRVADLGFVPYVRLDLGQRPGDRLPLREVVFGPTAHPNETRRGLVQALSNAGYANVEVVPSTIPWRSR
jgi:Protein of unknown function (DUF2971)